MNLSFIVFVLLVLGALFIIREQQTDFKSFESTIVFSKVYISWIWKVGVNVKDTIVFASNLDWMPELQKAPAQTF